LNSINEITGGDGIIGRVLNALKDFVCNTSTVPGGLTSFIDSLANYMDSRKFSAPTSVVNRFFNAIQLGAQKFIDGSKAFEGQFLNASNTDVPCILSYWNEMQIGVFFDIGWQLKFFPPNEIVVGAGFTCLSLDCWGCVTGISTLLSLIGGKRDILSDPSTTNATITFMAGGYSNSALNQCTRYGCTGGTWSDNVCACICTDTSQIWTPQYGCYNAQDYQNGQAPSGANPLANPNNPSYDPTVDPISPSYNASKDPDPYYEPYVTYADITQQSKGSLLAVLIIFIVLALFM